MKHLTGLLILLLGVAGANGQDLLQGVVDAASFAPRVAPGAIATIFGSNLADRPEQAAGFPLPRSLSGTTLYVNQAAVPLLYVSKNQINFQVPSGLAAGTANIYVSYRGRRSPVIQFSVVNSAPAIFQDSNNHAVAQNAIDYSVNSARNPVASGAVAVVYLTGQGPVQNAVLDGMPTPPAPLSTATSVATATIGGLAAPVKFLGLTPGLCGLAQANIQVPNLPTGDYPLVLTVGGYSSASAVVSISGPGTPPPAFVTLVSHLSFPVGTSSSIAVYGNTTYVCGANRIHIIRTSKITAPAYVGGFGDYDLAGYGGKCAINTNTWRPILVDLVGPDAAQSFAVYDISDPNNPVKLVQQYTAPFTYLSNFTFLGTTAFASTSWFETKRNSIIAQHGDFVAYDFSTLLPIPVSAVVPNGSPATDNRSPKPNVLALQIGNYNQIAYIATTTATGSSAKGNAALNVIDLANVLNMRGVMQVTTSTASIFLGLAYDHDLLLAAGNSGSPMNPGSPSFSVGGNLTIATMNIANTRAPIALKNVTTDMATTGTYAVQSLGPAASSVFAIVNNPPPTDPTGPASLMFVDARTPDSPALYSFTTQFGITDIAVSNGYLLVPDMNGLVIYKVNSLHDSEN
jgi:uncharacterized protein (TIGR03437 family)